MGSNYPVRKSSMHFRGVIAVCVLTASLAACGQRGKFAFTPQIAVTTSYLEAAVCDLLQTQVVVLRLSEPGTCPGHFDLRPSEARMARSCRLVLRFDFQKSLDPKLSAGTQESGPKICEINPPDGMCRPETYLSVCEQVAKCLSEAGLIDSIQAEARLGTIRSRLEILASKAQRCMSEAGLHGRPVIASHRQEMFCKWLGLKVVGTFRGADTSSIGEIENALKAGKLANVGLVIANSPEGRRAADSIASRLGAKVVLFDNFPRPKNGAVSFDEMVIANITRLVSGDRDEPIRGR
ncbi:MAG: hypothetical protein N3G20_12420, partial [Verrucomicrobiae bacterium]|nr:hypothetical protein [Verrucomicrobiae bacterium]